MANIGYPLTGVDPFDPTPGDVREFRFAQGSDGGGGGERTVALIANKTSAGSETVNTLGDPIQDLADCYTRFGRRSEMAWMYRMFVAVPQTATIYGIAASEHGSGTAASKAFTFATAATGATNLVIEWGGFKLYVPIAEGDTAITQAANVVAALTDWEEGTMPFTAAVGSNPNEHVVTITSAGLGPRYDLVIERIRMNYQRSVATTISVGSLTAGTNEDDHTTAYTVLSNQGPFYYIVSPKHTTSAPTTTDNGVGEGALMVATQALPTYGKGQQMIFGFVGTNAQLVTVCTALNNVRCKVYWSENSLWTPGMIAAHAAAIQRVRELAHAGANLTDYTASDTDVCLFPAPYDAADRPTPTEVRTALSNGGSVINFNKIGRSFIQRSITTRSLQGASNDYRAREGHIPSAIDYFYDNVYLPRHRATIQPFIASDPAQGQTPLAGVQYPSAAVALMRDCIRDASGPFIGGQPLLDPSPQVLAKSLASVAVIELADGTSLKADIAAVRHNLKSQRLINEVGPAY